MIDPTYIFYARFSNEKQKEVTNDDQFAACDVYWMNLREKPKNAKRELFSDSAISGDSIRARPAVIAMMDRVKQGGVSHLIIFSFDRLSRSQSEAAWLFEQLEFHRVELHTVRDGRITDMHVAMRGYEGATFLRKLSFDVKRGLQGAVKRGQILGSRLYGYRVVRSTEQPTGAREIDPNQAEVVILIFEMYVAGVSPKAICTRLNGEGVPSPRGVKWHPATLLGKVDNSDGLLRNRLYSGWHDSRRTDARRVPGEGRTIHEPRPRGEWVSTHHPSLQIVSDELWQAAQEQIAANARGPMQRVRRPVHLLSGLTKCGICGETYIVADATSFACSGHRSFGVCTNNRRAVIADVENAVLRGLQDHLLTPALLEPYVAEYQAELDRQFQESETREEGGAARLMALQTQIDKLLDRLINFEPDSPGAKAVSGKVDVLAAEKAELERRTVRKPRPLAAMSTRSVAERVQTQFVTLREQLTGAELEAARARQILRSIIDKVVISPVDSERRDGRGCGPVRLTVHGKMSELLTLADVEIGRVLLSGRGSYSRLEHATGAFVLHLDTTAETGVRKNASADQVPILFAIREAGRPLDVAELAAIVAQVGELDTVESRRAVHSRLRSCLDRMEGRGQVERVKHGRQVAFRLSDMGEGDEGPELAAALVSRHARIRVSPPRANVIVLEKG